MGNNPGRRFSGFSTPSRILLSDQTQHEHVRQLTHLLEQLPKRQKEVICLRYYQQLDYPEIAELMGLSRQTVYNT